VRTGEARPRGGCAYREARPCAGRNAGRHACGGKAPRGPAGIPPGHKNSPAPAIGVATNGPPPAPPTATSWRAPLDLPIPAPEPPSPPPATGSWSCIAPPPPPGCSGARGEETPVRRALAAGNQCVWTRWHFPCKFHQLGGSLGTLMGRRVGEAGEAAFFRCVTPFALQRAGNPVASPPKLFSAPVWHSCAKNNFLSCSLRCAKGTLYISSCKKVGAVRGTSTDSVNRSH
jgi:hypothetical protein